MDAMKSKTVVLMLNKVDLFKTKVVQKSIKVFFPEYNGTLRTASISNISKIDYSCFRSK